MTTRTVFLLAACLACQVSATGAPDGGAVSSLVANFDGAVAGGLPATLSLPGPARLSRVVRSLPDAIVVNERLAATVAFPGEAEGAMYAGTLNGDPAVFTRSGEQLDVSVKRFNGMDVASFVRGMPSVARADRRDALPGFAGGGPEAESGPGVSPAGRLRRDLATTPVPVSVPPGHREGQADYDLRFYVFLHDDLGLASPRQVHAQYVAWWMADLVRNVLPTRPLKVVYPPHQPWISDMAYGQPTTLDDFARAAALFSDATDGTYAKTYKHKFVLVTGQRPAEGVSGQAYEGGSVAVATIAGRYRVLAHEFGHLLGATHDLSKVAYEDGWWCETNMFPAALGARGNCYHYTPPNARRIRAYMRLGPDTEALPVLLAD